LTTPLHWLLLDAGNSALKWVLMTPEGQVGPAFGSARNAPPAEMTQSLAREWVDRISVPVQAVFGCGVAAPVLMRAMDQAVRKTFSMSVHWFDTQSSYDHDSVRLRNGYRDSTQLGVDRWHALLAARAAHPEGPLVVVTAGTATTIDGVTDEGWFVGGVIAPGVRMMYESLARGTANLPVAKGHMATYPDNTDDAITSGVIGAQIGVIERFVRSFRADHGEPMLVLAGGYAPQLAPYLGTGTSLPAIIREENLVLRGVYLRARSLAGRARLPTDAAR
jgi:type III pantothenate kinase